MKKLKVHVLIITLLLPVFSISQNSSKASEKNWVLSVGISEYNNKRIINLSYPAYDAASFLGQAKWRSKSSLFYAKPLYNYTATYSNVVAELRKVSSSAAAGDAITVFVSGHGIKNYILLFGNDKIAYTEIDSILSMSKCKNIFVILDVCYSGSSIIETSQNSGIIYMCSCKDNEQSYELSTLKHGVFSHFIIKGISGDADINRDSIITNQELFDYSSTGTKNQALKIKFKQTPVMTKSEVKPLLNIKR